MRLKRFLRFVMLLVFILIACIIPFPMKFYKRDSEPSCEIEQVDTNKEDENSDDDYQAFS